MDQVRGCVCSMITNVVHANHLMFHKQEPGAIVGVIGANGCGKTTLFNVLSGKVAPDAGTIELGPTVKLGVVSQLRDELDDNKTVYQEIAQSEDFITVCMCVGLCLFWSIFVCDCVGPLPSMFSL